MHNLRFLDVPTAIVKESPEKIVSHKVIVEERRLSTQPREGSKSSMEQPIEPLLFQRETPEPEFLFYTKRREKTKTKDLMEQNQEPESEKTEKSKSKQPKSIAKLKKKLRGFHLFKALVIINFVSFLRK